MGCYTPKGVIRTQEVNYVVEVIFIQKWNCY